MVYLGMKRGREGEVSTMVSIANCLMLLSDSIKSNPPSRLFECKTCNRQFSSFQALGGHTASHKKQRFVESELIQCLPPKPKTHECPICGLEFMVGQALGGHMRRHKVAASEGYGSTELTLFPPQVPPKEENSGEFVCLDLNLTPSENGLDFHLNKVAPKVICFL